MLAYSSSVFQIGECGWLSKAFEASTRQQCTLDPLHMYSPATILSKPVHMDVERPNWRLELIRYSAYIRIVHHSIKLLKGDANAIPRVIRRESWIFIGTIENRLNNSISDSSWYMSMTNTGSKYMGARNCSNWMDALMTWYEQSLTSSVLSVQWSHKSRSE